MTAADVDLSRSARSDSYGDSGPAADVPASVNERGGGYEAVLKALQSHTR